GSLQERLVAEGAQPPGRALEWLEQAAGALDAAHREGVVHRDVKPANLLLDRHDRVHVADFGIASAAGMNSLTQTGTVLGTASYLSPEQAKGERTTPASDLYSLGVVAFELLTGRRPFEGDSMAAEALAHVTGEVPSVCEVNPSIPCQLDPVFAKALAKDPGERYGSGAEFVAALRASLDEAAGSTSVIPPPPAQRAAGRPVSGPAPRRRPSWLVPALVLLALGGAGAGIAGAVLSGGDGKKALPPVRQSVSVKTVTQPGTTVVTTAPAPTTAPPPTTTPPVTTTAQVSGDAYTLNNRAYELMKRGDFTSALPLLENAVQQLQGHTDLTTAYTNYNLGVTLIELGRCSEAMPYLETSRQIQPQRSEVYQAMKVAKHCSKGGSEGDNG
ncbi:MAG: eukaryotic-like serine/threonine-protein kinase, partial [Gaiellaceae bacterium]|nr:eukaryotic-like serine/threonine-protein kinase [Gaiellaceae bacterium]